MTESVLFSPLPEWGILQVEGVEARNFLHGQFTNHLEGLPTDQFQWSAYCSPKGRIIGNFLIGLMPKLAPADTPKDSYESFFLLMDRSLIVDIHKRLKMFILRSKVKLHDISAEWNVYALASSTSPSLPNPLPAPMQETFITDKTGGSTGVLLRLPNLQSWIRQLLLLPSTYSINTLAPDLVPTPSQSPSDNTAWMRLMILAGEPWLSKESSEQFIPQMINYELVGGVHFRKGCYPGQEIIVRAHHRGVVKRRMYLAWVDAHVQVGDKLYASNMNYQESGQVINTVSCLEGGSYILAVLPIDSRENAQIRWGGATGTILDFRDLPYLVPSLNDPPPQ